MSGRYLHFTRRGSGRLHKAEVTDNANQCQATTKCHPCHRGALPHSQSQSERCHLSHLQRLSWKQGPYPIAAQQPTQAARHLGGGFLSLQSFRCHLLPLGRSSAANTTCAGHAANTIYTWPPYTLTCMHRWSLPALRRARLARALHARAEAAMMPALPALGRAPCP